MPLAGSEQDQYDITTFKTYTEEFRFLENSEAHMLSKGDDIIGALQESYPEKIWISNTASKQDQFIAANLLGLLILRQDLKDD